MITKRVYRSQKEKVIFGVCGGIAEYFDVDPVIIRMLFVAFGFVWGASIAVYIILAFVLPENPHETHHHVDSEHSKEHHASQAADTTDRLVKDVRESAEHIANKVHEHLGHHKHNRSGANILGIIIILVGLVLLVSHLNPFFGMHLFYFWPLVIIVIGVFLVTRSRR